MRWRRTFRAFHRDIGFAVSALLLAYSISGLAVNHMEDWNPNYTFHERTIELGALPQGSYHEMQDFVASALNIESARVKGHFMESETQFRVFLSNAEEIGVDVRDGRGKFKQIKTRPGLYEINALHLNSIKGIWTWVADLFAILLIVLVVTGLFMMKGSRGLAGRGKYFIALGLLVPVVFIWFVVAGA